MKTKQAFLLLVFVLGISLVQAGTLTVGVTDPTVDGADIALLPGATTTINPNDATTAVWFDKPQQGQTFTTGSDTEGYKLSAVSLLHNFGPSAFVWTQTGPWDIAIGTIDGSGNFNAIATDSVALGATAGFTSSDGTPDWLTFTLDTAVTLAADTTYAFAVGINFGDAPVQHTGAVFVRSDNNADYTGGSAFSDSIGGGGFDNPVVTREFDRVFHLDMEVVPEPATLALLGLGGVLLRRRR